MGRPLSLATPAARRSADRPQRRGLLTSIAVLALTVGVYGAATVSPAHAVTPDITAPERLYTGVNQPFTFDGTPDPISDDTRAITVDVTDGAVCHTDPTMADYSLGGCSRVQLDLSTPESGLMFIPGSTIANTMYTNNSDVIVASTGAIIDQATDPMGGPSQVYHINGNQAQINDTLADLAFQPATDYEETSLQPTILHVVAVNGNGMASPAEHDIEIKVEGTNGAPTLTVPATPVDAAVSNGDPNDEGVAYPVDPADPPLATVVDPEMCNLTVCGAPYTNPGGVEDDDAMLLIAWLDPACGEFHLRGGSFPVHGGVLNSTVLALLTNVDTGQNPGLDLAGEQAAPILSTLGLQAQTVDLQAQPSDTSTLTNNWAGVGSLDDVRYALSQITYKAPTTEMTCTLDVAVSDLGNSGMPAPHGYVGSPIGGMDQPQPGYEIPDAKADVQAITFKVKDTHPDVTIEQTSPGLAGDPTNMPAEFTATFDQQVNQLTQGDLTIAGLGAGTVDITPVGPATTYDIKVTPSPDSTVTVSLAAGKVHATAAPMDTNDASTSTDNMVTYDHTSPPATVGGTASQTATPVIMTVDFGEAVNGAGFTGADVTVGGVSGATTAVVTPLTSSTYQLAISGMTQSGSVTAAVHAGAVKDLAGNDSLAGSGSVMWTSGNPPDMTAPTVTVEQAGSDPATTLPIPFTATFSEPVVGFTSSDVQLAGTASVGATVSISGSGPVYTINVGNVTQTGTIIASIPASSVTDLSLNSNTMPSTSVDNVVTYNKPGLATHFTVSAPPTAQRNTAFSVVVTALDASNATATTYTGPLDITSTDNTATSPSGVSLVNGTGTFSVTLNGAGNSYTVTAHDSVTNISGTSAAISLSNAALPAATHLAVTSAASTTAGNTLMVTVTALDISNATATSYAGLVHFTSTDGAATLPANAHLVNGTATFPVMLDTAGNQSVTATDTVTSSIKGTVMGVAVSPAAATHFSMSGVSSASTNSAISVTVTAKDAFNNTATGYAGTVKFASSDPMAVKPANSTLVNGAKAFNVTFKTAGMQTLTATDTVTASIAGAKSVSVTGPGAATHFSVTTSASATAGVGVTVTVTALDAANLTATSYAGTAHLTSSDGASVLGANAALVNGTGSFNATLKTAGNQTVTATDMATPSITGTTGTIAVSPAATATLTVTLPAQVNANSAFSTVVTAIDAFGNTTPAYAGTVHFTTSDVAATAPTDATLTNGVGVIPTTLKTAGSQSLTATDTVSAGITGMGSTSVSALAAAAATHFAVSAASTATAGTPTNVTVTALDGSNNPTTNYAGTVMFTAAGGTPPANSTLTNGFGIFPVTFTTAGSHTVSATDAVTSSITGVTGTIAVAAGPATNLTVSAPASDIINAPVNVTVTAFDQYGNVANGYGGVLHFTSTDPAAVLPVDAGLISGVGSFQATPKTVGSRTITATDTVTSSITGTSGTIAVSAPLPATQFGVSTTASSAAGAAVTITVTAKDTNGIPTANYTGSVHFTSTDSAAVLPANLVLVNGVGTTTATLKTAGIQTITATDTVTPSKTGVTGSINVTPASATHLTVSAPPTASNGVAVTVTVTARDQFENVATAYAGTDAITSSDGAATLPASGTLTNGSGTFAVTLHTNGSKTVTATDTVTSSITGTSAAIAVSAAPPNPATHFSVTLPASSQAGSAVAVTVTALDAGNAATSGYSGTVHLTSSDGSATLSTDTALVNGVGVLSATLRTAGNQVVTATDTTTSSITGISGIITVAAVAATHLSVTAPSTATAGSPVSAIVRALDPFGNTDTGYAGNVHITSSDASAVLPANATLVNGVGTFPVTLVGLGSSTVSATDTVTSSITGTSAAISVSNTAQGAATHLSVSAPVSATANTGFSVTVTALDAANSTASGYTGTVHFTSTSNGTLPADVALVNGVGVFPVTLTEAGPQTVTVKDTSTPSIAGTSAPIDVAAGAAVAFKLSTPVLLQVRAFNPNTQQIEDGGHQYMFTVTAVDQFGNVATSYNGVVHFSSDDPTAVLPADVALVNGFGTFTATLNWLGSTSISVSDPSNPAIASATVSGVTVTADPTTTTTPTPTVPPTGALPTTGSDSVGVLWPALIMLISGGVLLGVRSRRRRPGTSRV
ncbi:MAG: hypothetical protein JWM34_240 [Ilumatobacteraceae bacterium]|nr:hypothetical protein [Ilumatobacteraceae bacterium]